MPDHLKAYGETWERHHPGWEFCLWNEDNLPPLQNQQLFDMAEVIAPNNVGQFRADIARYELLHTRGGVYVDTDMECLQPLDSLIAGVDCFAGWELANRWVNNAVLGSVAGHPFLAALVDGLEANVRRKRGARPNVLSGPGYVTPMYRRFAKQVTVFKQRTFYPYGFADVGTDREKGPFPDSYACHHWENTRSGSRAALHRRSLSGNL